MGEEQQEQPLTDKKIIEMLGQLGERVQPPSSWLTRDVKDVLVFTADLWRRHQKNKPK